MTLSEELRWRGFVNQTTYKDPDAIDKGEIRFYLGIDPSADSMTIGNLAVAMMVRHFIAHGHEAYLLVGGATGMIGDPDGKKRERDLLTLEQIDHNKRKIAGQFEKLFSGMPFTLVDNYDWFKDIGYLAFLRDVGKHVPLSQMLGRDFVQSRLGDEGSGISYAEFSYALIQGYDFLHLHREYGVNLQICGADQWGNSITGVDLIRRITGDEAHVWAAPLIINKTTGVKFGKSESGAVWLDPERTSPTQFYQFWINVDDAGVEDYLKIYTLLNREEIDSIMEQHNKQPEKRIAQRALAREVTSLVHGEENARLAEAVTAFLTGERSIGEADSELAELRNEVAHTTATTDGSIIQALSATGLAASNSEARRLLAANAIAVNGEKVNREQFVPADFQNGRLIIRRGKAYKDSALIELG